MHVSKRYIEKYDLCNVIKEKTGRVCIKTESSGKII